MPVPIVSLLIQRMQLSTKAQWHSLYEQYQCCPIKCSESSLSVFPSTSLNTNTGSVIILSYFPFIFPGQQLPVLL